MIVCLIKRRVRKIREKNQAQFEKSRAANNQTGMVVSAPVYVNEGSYQSGPLSYPPNANAPGLVAPSPNYPLPIVYGPPPVVYGQTQGLPSPDSNLQRIDPTNFAVMVPLVNLDPTNTFIGQNTCVICKGLFSPDVDTRVLPCMHAFHGRCIYDVIILPMSKNCPVCNRQYA